MRTNKTKIMTENTNTINGLNFETKTTKDWKCCTYRALPKWLQDNDYLHSGHRPPLNSMSLCFRSIFRVHTETGNIWTHILGFVLIAFIAKILYAFNTYKTIDLIMLSVYITGALTCHLLSSVYHVCKCHSSDVSQLFHRLDYSGISLQIIGSMIPVLYYAFYNNMKWCYIYSTFATTLFFIALVMSVRAKFALPKYRPLRTGVFLVFGLSSVLPCLHWLYVIEPEFVKPFYLVVTQGALYVAGALIYARRIPERYFAGKCDICPQSHQIFHIMVTIAAIVHLSNIYGMILLRQSA